MYLIVKKCNDKLCGFFKKYLTLSITRNMQISTEKETPERKEIFIFLYMLSETRHKLQ